MSVYAISDLHGRIDLYKEVKNFLKPDDKVYCLGDCGDRGPAPWETIKTIAADKQFIYIKGNHEDMLIKAMKEYIDEMGCGDEFSLLCYNGGMDTFNGWIEDSANSGWYHYLKRLPSYLEYKNTNGFTIALCHAGFTPGMQIPNNEDLIWSRDHFYEHAIENKIICVHGHTPIPLMIDGWKGVLKRTFGAEEDTYTDGAFWYCNNHKVNIDCGSYATGKTLLLDLDTFDEHIFTI